MIHDDNVVDDDTVAGYADKRGVAKLLGLSKRTVEHLMAEGLPHYRIGNRRTRFILREVQQWVNEKYRVQRRGN